MIRDVIHGFNKVCSLEELKSIGQYKFPFDILSENNLPYYKDMTPTELNEEEFRKYPADENVEVSNLGRVRIGNKILNQVDDIRNHPNGGWLCLECPEYKSLHNKYVYHLVADTWLGANPGNIKDGWYHRHHINNNGYDNRPENLIWLTKEEHGKIPKPTKVKEN